MRSRRRFIALLASTGTAAVAGCLDRLPDGDGNGGPGESETYRSSSGAIFVTPTIDTYSVEAEVTMMEAERVTVQRNGNLATVIRASTQGLLLVTDAASEGENYRLVAEYPDGSREVLDQRCIECDSGTSGSGSGGPNDEPHPNAEFTFSSTEPTDGFSIAVQLTVGAAESVVITHQGVEVAEYQEGGQKELTGDGTQGRPLQFEDVEHGDVFAAVAEYESWRPRTIAEAPAVPRTHE